jgi:hypothetical protein
VDLIFLQIGGHEVEWVPLLEIIHNIRDFTFFGQVTQAHLVVVQFTSRWHHILEHDHGRIIRDSESFGLEVLERHVSRVLPNLINSLDEGRVQYL